MKFCETCKEQFAGHLNFALDAAINQKILRQVWLLLVRRYSERHDQYEVRKYISFIGFIVIAALLFGVYQFGAYKFSKEKQVNEMLEAFQKRC